MSERKGCVQVYTGDGKGKTTAAIGLSVRAAGAGMTVFFCQFMKTPQYSEHESLKRYEDTITVASYGTGAFVRGKPVAEDIEIAKNALADARKRLVSGEFDIVVLDEINVAVHFGLVEREDVLDLIDARPAHVELIMTGRNVHPDVIERADLVTEMKKIKHYYDAGIPARRGIEM